MHNETLLILGSRGIPASHGGFETLAEHLSLYLASRGWKVTVYCQVEGTGTIAEDVWCGIRRVLVPVDTRGALGTILFDLKATLHARRQRGTVLVLGYNTAVLNLLLCGGGRRMVMNMDGIEWKREKWSLVARSWLRLNEWIGSRIAHRLIADHPEIERHLNRLASGKKIMMIPYGGPWISHAPTEPIRELGLTSKGYALVIARPEPENSILEIVRAFSSEQRGIQLVVLGNFDVVANPYHRKVMAAAGEEIRFLGAIYEQDVVTALRFHAKLYVHGHTVGGTNPSLVEALGAGNAVLAHDNPFNRWVAGREAEFFADEAALRGALSRLLDNPDRLAQMERASRERQEESFTWDSVLAQYEHLLRTSEDAPS